MLQAGCHHVMEPRMIRSVVTDYSRHIFDILKCGGLETQKRGCRGCSRKKYCVSVRQGTRSVGSSVVFTTRPVEENSKLLESEKEKKNRKQNRERGLNAGRK